MKNFQRVLLSGLCLILIYGCFPQKKGQTDVTTMPIPAIIPRPLQMTEQNGTFTFSPLTRIQFDNTDPEVTSVVNFLNAFFEQSAGFVFKQASSQNSQGNVIILNLTNSEGKEGSYELKIDQDRIEIQAHTAKGLFYGVQTIRQLLPPQIESNEQVSNITWSVPCLKIKDESRFSYRGLHLDVGRHFFPVSFIKKYIDLMALHKLNTFHWHLTEDQGWRIEIKKYPKLTEIGGFRSETLIGHGGRPPFKFDGKRYGGFYTQDEIREVVAYAKSRFVTVIPEIELPGHSSAALAAYPELGCTGGPYQVQTRWGVFEDVYCAGNDKVFSFMEDVLDEVVNLFPGTYIHIGGDECPKKAWEECQKCQARIAKEGLADEHELQSYFIRRIEKYLLTKDRYIIGWDEILEGGLAPRATVMSWRGMEGGIEAAKQKHDVIMTPGSHCYLDHYQADPETQPLAIGGYTTLEKIYSFNPVPDELNPKEQKHILGAQGNVWTEYMKTTDHVEYMVYPRACALAEVVWTSEKKHGYENFLRRLEVHYDRLKTLNVNYFYQVEKPLVKSSKLFFLDEIEVQLKKPFEHSEIRYTIDGSEPSLFSTLYKDKIKLARSTDLKAITINKKNNEISPVLNVKVKKLEFIQPSNHAPKTKGLKLTHYTGSFASVSNLDTCKKKDDSIAEAIMLPEVEIYGPFGLRFSGFLNINKKGIYYFRLESDDGSRMFLNGELFIDNDGYHSSKSVSSGAALQKGYYPIEIQYFQGGGGAKIELNWRMERTQYSEIPADQFFH
jgi:hexosaminidase